MTTDSLIGVGLYSIPHAAQLLKIETSTIRRWADGYRYHREGVARPVAPVIARDLGQVEGASTLTFQELMELRLIKLLRGEKISMPTIRAALEKARHYFDHRHPFAIQRIRTDGRQIFADLTARDVPEVSAGRLTLELIAGQYIMEKLATPYLRDVDYEPEEAARWWPLGRNHLVVLDPSRNAGNPIDPETGVSSYVLVNQVRAGDSVAQTARWYRVTEKAVCDALALEEYLKAA